MVDIARESASRGPFAVTKWYLDCVSADGRSAIAYATLLRWHRLSVEWFSLELDDGERPVRRWSTRHAALPRREDGSILWGNRALGCALETEPLNPPFARTLFRDEEGAVEWFCEAPAARTRVEIADAAVLEGLGYAERLELSLLPWSLGIAELRWGRWIAADGSHNMVWIDWRGARPLTAVFVDGSIAAQATVVDGRVEAAGVTLLIGEQRAIVSRGLGDVIGPIARLAPLVPRAFLGSRETKWAGRATASGFGAVPVAGTVLHEVVRFGT